MIFVLIAGASASGKTTFAQILLDELQQDSISCQLINMDNYYKERDVSSYPDLALFLQEPKFYLPTNLCLQQLSDDLASLTQGQPFYQKTFDFTTNLYKRNEQGECILNKIEPSDIIIMEGLFAQHFANEYLPMDYPRISVNMASSSYLNIIKARLERDTASRPLGRERTAKQVRTNECNIVGPVFFQYTAKNATGSDVYVVNNYGNENLQGVFFEEEIQAIKKEINKIQQALESNQYVPKKRPPDALQMVKNSQGMFHAQSVRNKHPMHDLIQELQKRSETFGPFFKSPTY